MSVCLVYLAGPLLLSLLVLVAVGVGARTGRARSSTKRLLAADRQLQDAARQARMHMNDAAGQSWRNLVE